ncbi:MAG: IS3 family transposase [Lawsonibacter sp.]
MPHQETLWQSRRMRSIACRWRTNCCGIFCGPQEGSEGKGKIPHHISSQRGISNIRHVHVFAVSRSGYYAFVHRLDRPEKDPALAKVIAQQRERSFRTYGYRRMWLWLKSQNIFCNPKTVLRIMKKYDLLSEIRRRRKWQQMGQQVHRYENLLNRGFHADGPNRKWVTDISYIHTKQGVLYLSMIRDLYDNSIVAYKTGTEQTVGLVLDTIRLAMKREKKKVAAELHLHSDQGFQYTSRAYFNLTQAYGITPSMSRKGNPYDNAMAENFFSILKTECIYRHKPATFPEANEMIDRYIHFYNHERIQLKTGEAPLARRLSY